MKISMRRLLKPPSPSLNISRRKIDKIVKETPPGKVILDLGSGHRKLSDGAINLDIYPFRFVNVVGDGHRLPLKDESVDVIICQAVLEHVKEPAIVVREMHRVLKKGCAIYVEIPFLQGYHADPADFQRYTIRGIERLMMPFEKEDVGVCVGPVSTFCWWIRKMPTIFIRNRSLAKGMEFVSGWLTFWLKYLDLLFIKAANAHIIAAGLFFRGKKN
ncbi:MAG: methyltransferase domain-containing protein [candidate division KSB1 bacterium]|jgi:SAM-dependent methyltransferase|nr:methyltransferase domain-containing protein [candidate division KSB1 bacterium]